MKKAVILMILVLILGLPIAVYAAGEQAYVDASEALASGDIATARTKFAQAASELSGAGKSNAQFISDFLDKMGSEASEPKVIKMSAWRFIGEVIDSNGVHHLYYDEYANSVFHSRVEDGASPDELVAELGLSMSQKKVTGDSYGYKSDIRDAAGDMKSRTRIWACGDTTHIVYETFSDGKAGLLDSLFSTVECPSSPLAGVLIVMLIIGALVGGGAYLYLKTDVLKFDWIGKIWAKLRSLIPSGKISSLKTQFDKKASTGRFKKIWGQLKALIKTGHLEK